MSEPLTDYRPHYPHTAGREEMWSQLHPYVQTAWDSTSLSSYMQCSRRYFYEIINGWRPQALNADILFGSAVHDSIELYERERLAGAEHQPALRKAVRNALRMARGGYQDQVSGEILHGLAEAEDTAKNAHTLVRIIVWWADDNKDGGAFPVAALGDGRPGLEVSFRFPLDLKTPDGESYLLVGHFDKIATYAGDPGGVERKTTKTTLSKYFWDRYSPNVQIDNYFTASKIVFPEPAKFFAVEAFQTAVNFMRHERHMVHRTPAYLEEHYDDLLYWIKRAEMDAIRGKWPMNKSACGNHGGCPYRRICSKDPGMRETYLKGDYQKLPWNPLRNR